MATLTPEERKAKLQARMAALQEQMEKVERGEPLGGGRGRAPNPMGSTEEFGALTRVIKSHKTSSYGVIAGIITSAFEEGIDEDMAEALKAKGEAAMAALPATERKRKAKDTAPAE
jgi:hypothetical protein